MKPSELAALIARVEAATGPNFDLECHIGSAVEPERMAWCGYPPNYTHSLDAALSLVERVLPGCEVRIDRKEDATGRASAHRDGGSIASASAPTPALALVLATLKAIQAAQLARSEGQ